MFYGEADWARRTVPWDGDFHPQVFFGGRPGWVGSVLWKEERDWLLKHEDLFAVDRKLADVEAGLIGGGSCDEVAVADIQFSVLIIHVGWSAGFDGPIQAQADLPAANREIRIVGDGADPNARQAGAVDDIFSGQTGDEN